jgi:putative ABC transport system permease protein
LSPVSFLVVRSSKPAATLAPVIEREIHASDKDAVVRRLLTMEDVLSESVAEPRFRTLLLAAFGGLALVLAAIGIYGVIAYSVTQRTQEIGIRMALGAQRSHVLMMVMRHGALLVVVGLGIGLVGGLLVARALSRFLFAIGPGDPLAFALAVILLACVGLAAAMIPALRATKIDPLVALRYE